MKLNKKIYKQKKGITLVALVITIVILLILAGISIAQLTGNGLFENAKLAKEKYKNEQEKENKTLSDYENLIEDEISNNRDTVTISKEEYDKLKNANTYTLDEEMEVGKWINGKTIYRKVISIPSGVPNRTTGNINIVGDYSWVENFIRADGMTDGSTDNSMSTVFCRSEGNTGLTLYCAEGFTLAKYLVLEYTKKTD